MADYRDILGSVGVAVDILGVIVILVGILFATSRFLFKQKNPLREKYQLFRHDLARAILLGLEFLIAGDIIRTVAVTPTLSSVAVLGLIVMVRTFLMIALHLEVEGRWPWQKPPPRDETEEAHRVTTG
jgi:uncharacterized membrane protein